MGYLDKKIEEITNKFSIRYRKKQKEEFLKYAENEFARLGLSSKKIKNNLIVGEDDAGIIISAHYDTPFKMPLGFDLRIIIMK